MIQVKLGNAPRSLGFICSWSLIEHPEAETFTTHAALRMEADFGSHFMFARDITFANLDGVDEPFAVAEVYVREEPNRDHPQYALVAGILCAETSWNADEVGIPELLQLFASKYMDA